MFVTYTRTELLCFASRDLSDLAPPYEQFIYIYIYRFPDDVRTNKDFKRQEFRPTVPLNGDHDGTENPARRR